MFTFDHIAIAAETLAEGVEYVEDTLGVKMNPGGEHPLMGTHNRLLGLKDDLYLEVIAINPDAARPPHPRWFDLDNFKGEPRITNWILRCDDLKSGLSQAPAGAGVPLSLSRGDLRWQMAVPKDGKLPYDNIAPALITWEGNAHPVQRLPITDLRLSSFEIQHPEISDLASCFDKTNGPDLCFLQGTPGFAARFETPSGSKVLR
ncbi:MAG: VOC family protein [Halocynthiibacter sp.]